MENTKLSNFTDALLGRLEEDISYDPFDNYKEEPLIEMSFESLEDIVSEVEEHFAMEWPPVTLGQEVFLVCLDFYNRPVPMAHTVTKIHETLSDEGNMIRCFTVVDKEGRPFTIHHLENQTYNSAFFFTEEAAQKCIDESQNKPLTM